MRIPFEIVFEDEHLIVLNKTAKILIQPSPKKEKNTLTSLLRKQLNKKVFPCHRLDRETTGLIIYAKNNSIEESIIQEFRMKQVEKKYVAFIKGKLINDKGVLKGKVLDQEGRKFGEKPKEAKTFYKVLEVFFGWSIIELKPFTGRTNQLRIQLAEINHPILGESKYALRRDFKIKFRRLALHASSLSFTHPVSGRRINLDIDLAKDMKEFLKKEA